MSDESHGRNPSVGFRQTGNWPVGGSVTVRRDKLKRSTYVFVLVLEQRVSSSMKCIMCRSGARVMVDVVNGCCCEETAFELRSTESICNMVVMAYLVAKLSQNVQYMAV